MSILVASISSLLEDSQEATNELSVSKAICGVILKGDVSLNNTETALFGDPSELKYLINIWSAVAGAYYPTYKMAKLESGNPTTVGSYCRLFVYSSLTRNSDPFFA